MTATAPAPEVGYVAASGKRVRQSPTSGRLWTTECDDCVGLDLAAQLECLGPCIRPRLSALGGMSGQGRHVMPKWRNTGEMIRDIAESNLPYLTPTRRTFDATSGKMVFWKHWQPDHLVTNDLFKPADYRWDWTSPPPAPLVGKFDTGFIDAPFKNDGTTRMMIGAYGLEPGPDGRPIYTEERLDSMLAGMVNVAATLDYDSGLEHGPYLFVKCQAQQSNGSFQDQPFAVKTLALTLGWEVVTQFYLQYRPISQDHRGPQRSPSSNLSHMIVLAPVPAPEPAPAPPADEGGLRRMGRNGWSFDGPGIEVRAVPPQAVGWGLQVAQWSGPDDDRTYSRDDEDPILFDSLPALLGAVVALPDGPRIAALLSSRLAEQ